MKDRATLICSDYKGLSIRRQCEVLEVPRSSLYYKPKGENEVNLKLMGIMDRHLTDHPTEGVVSMVYLLTGLGFVVGPKRIRRLFRLMGRETLYRRKNLTKSGLREYIRPYLLRNLKIERPNQVWVTDITYIPMQKGFMFLTAVMDVYSRRILSWGISNSQDAKWCKQVIEEAIREYGKPEIVNSDQGSQYTSALWINYLEGLDIKVSMDGKGRALDNVYIERFWKSIKYDYIYLNPSEDGYDLLKGVKKYIEYYNQKVHHTTREKPGERYFGATQKAA
ncbi:IS3 family transposase [Cecembia calidifontis]|jgi:putative transposase|uniref:Putative transposase n=1 Tax=Cecembia calidifontis TaxID=1187080 RepID=A0A4Q7PDI1_9BACT|nr:IS3 family transposase [Cecembia calidifontis]RZS94593.1 putative transposase [Cecembia calidifontis]RZS94888.1 putative transposase [Cecembia calidifontis]RZS96305.1 putative transposase [Cecembia calidifontis]RZS96309.1 putative transposase [Cecembia calidifontis]RZS96326.1 putative transposase [Cecembia calidifontis]